MLKLTRPCEHCGGRQILACESQIPGLPIRNLLHCFCCESIFTKPDENDNVFYLHIGDKN